MRRYLYAAARRLRAQARRSAHPDYLLVAAEFDRDWYLSVNPDVARARVDPVEHFLSHGWQEGRDPHPRFSTREYLNNYPDIARAGVNPFVHFLQAGRAEGRSATHDLGFRYEILSKLRPLDEEAAAAAKATARVRTDAPEALARGLAESRTGFRELYVTVSHDDYRVNVGGVQLCLQKEAAQMAERGVDHLHLFPAHPWPVVRPDGQPGKLGVILNDRLIGTFAPATVVEAFAAAVGGRAPDGRFAIHSLLGHAAGETIEILKAAGLGRGFFWLHDYASLCAGFNLLRDGVEDCGAPPPDSAACGICVYGPWRGRHLAAHEELFRRLELTVISPAASTLAFWEGGWDFPPAEHVVHPHARLVQRGPAPVASGPRPLRVAYLGYPVPHKGWPLFRRLLVQYVDDPRYAFFHLGAQSEAGLAVEHHEVRVTAERPRAMQETLEALEIDVVLFWPLWRETFSFTVYEAIAAGCAVITGPDSGNVAAVVAATGAGWVLPDEAALEAAMAEGRPAELARAARRPMLYDLNLSGMTVDLLPARAEA